MLTVQKAKKKLVFRKVVLDPGSDLNLMSYTAAKMIEPRLRPTKSTVFNGVAMRTADGARHRLTQVAEVDFQLLGRLRWRQEFFVMPSVCDEGCGFSLLLELPWLYDAYATFDMRLFQYTVQHYPSGELVTLVGPEYEPRKFSNQHARRPNNQLSI